MVGDKHISIPNTLLISAVAIISDWRKVITSNFKAVDNLIYIVGKTKPELGASEYFRDLKLKEGLVPKIDKHQSLKTHQNLSTAIGKSLVNSCHDLSEGGAAVALAEMCIGSNKGASIFLAEAPQAESMLDYEVLFSESPSRFIVEVAKDKKKAFEKELGEVSFGLLGCVTKDKKLVIYNKKSKAVVNLTIEEMRESWQNTFKKFR